MNVVIINPPLVQINAPYPSGAYLSSFFKKNDCLVRWYDLSLELYYSIFSRTGLEKLFDLTAQNALSMAAEAEKNGDDATAFNLRRYVSTSNSWISWIDDINAILCGQGREKEHQFLYSPFAPRGNRMETFLANLGHEPTVDDVRFLCSYALADLADYITAVFDSNFSLIRYAESVAADKRSFTEVEAALDSPVLKFFYEAVLENVDVPASPDLFLISVPFAGTFVPALYTARFLRKKFPDAKIAIGGGYVNTEMREWTESSLGKYVDFISYDRGYGSYSELLKVEKLGSSTPAESENQVYKLLKFVKTAELQSPELKSPDGEITIIPPLWQDETVEKLEAEITRTTFPDYSDIDFSRYPRVCDDKNPMHRMWSDGAWIKAYLAHGCYWHRCAFCDTKLDYVCGYKIVDVEGLYETLLSTARQKGVYGVHFVDEALPPVAVLRFALCNARHGNPLYFWGNVRFEKAWTKDLAALLSACGFGGVSAGIEVATGQGLKNINKGTDIQSIVSACAAFKEAGILVHAYMIYGFWYDTPQTIIDSMETLRQFYAAGLLDSSFWHQFMLTRYSPKYDELKSTFNPHQYEKFGPALDAALDSWMHGEKLEMKVQKWFNFPVPAPTIPRDFVEKCIEKYEADSEIVRNLNIAETGKTAQRDNLFWIASVPVIVVGGKNSTTIRWIYLQEEIEITLQMGKEKTEAFVLALKELSPAADVEKRRGAAQKIAADAEFTAAVMGMKNKGVVFI